MPTLVRTTFLEVTVGGLLLSGVLWAHVTLGFDLAVSEATIGLAVEPEDTAYNDTVTVAMGAGGDGGNNNTIRFTGLLKQYDRTLYPRQITLVARGRLSRAAEYRNPRSSIVEEEALRAGGIPGMLLETLLGGGAATDENIVLAALERVPDLGADIGLIGGTGTDLSGLPPDALTWQFGETALSFIQRIDAAALGFRTFESIGGSIFRAQISGWPAADPVYTFVEGLDIFEAHSTRTILELKNQARVDGYNYGLGSTVITFTAPGSNPIQGDAGDNAQEIQFSTSLAGRILSGDPGQSFACEDIANYLLAEWNRELVRLQLTTPRDDIIGPGQTHMVRANVADNGHNAGGTVDRLGIGEPLWVQRVEISVDERGAFSQTMTYIGGGVANGYDSPIDWSNQ